MKDMLVAMARKDTKEKQAVRELSTMLDSELRHKAHAKGLDDDGSRDMLISALSQHDLDNKQDGKDSESEDEDDE